MKIAGSAGIENRLTNCCRALILAFSPREKEPLSHADYRDTPSASLAHSLPLGETHAQAAVRGVFNSLLSVLLNRHRCVRRWPLEEFALAKRESCLRLTIEF
jgi:hypothetical protein